MSILRTHRALLASLSLVLVVNAIALAGVEWNRSGEPEALLKLSQRELSLPWPGRFNKENSGLKLSLQWRVLAGEGGGISYYSYRGNPSWLDEKKMRELGFQAESEREQRSRQAARDAFLVLELDGDAYGEAVRRAENRVANDGGREQSAEYKVAERNLKAEKTTASRLFVIDAGLDPADLRKRYADRAKFAIVRGRISPALGEKERGGTVSGVAVEEVSVPLEFHAVFGEAQAAFPQGPNANNPFLVTMAFGRRLEPWIVQASKG